MSDDFERVTELAFIAATKAVLTASFPSLAPVGDVDTVTFSSQKENTVQPACPRVTIDAQQGKEAPPASGIYEMSVTITAEEDTREDGSDGYWRDLRRLINDTMNTPNLSAVASDADAFHCYGIKGRGKQIVSQDSGIRRDAVRFTALCMPSTG